MAPAAVRQGRVHLGSCDGGARVAAASGPRRQGRRGRSPLAAGQQRPGGRTLRTSRGLCRHSMRLNKPEAGRRRAAPIAHVAVPADEVRIANPTGSFRSLSCTCFRRILGAASPHCKQCTCAPVFAHSALIGNSCLLASLTLVSGASRNRVNRVPPNSSPHGHSSSNYYEQPIR